MTAERAAAIENSRALHQERWIMELECNRSYVADASVIHSEALAGALGITSMRSLANPPSRRTFGLYVQAKQCS